MQEVMERRFRWTVRQVLAAVSETERAGAESVGRGEAAARESAFRAGRLTSLRLFFTAVDAAIGAFTQGKAVDAEVLQNVVPLSAATGRQRR
jgi:hypothetical protein